jgi:hypothetical protein
MPVLEGGLIPFFPNDFFNSFGILDLFNSIHNFQFFWYIRISVEIKEYAESKIFALSSSSSISTTTLCGLWLFQTNHSKLYYPLLLCLYVCLLSHIFYIHVFNEIIKALKIVSH